MEVRKGQKIILHDTRYVFTFKMAASSKVVPDISAFLIGADGKVTCDNDFVFYGNSLHESGAVACCNSENPLSGSVDLNLVPNYIEKIAITATIYDVGKNFSQVHGAFFSLVDSNDNEFAKFLMDAFTVENAIVIGEFYRYKGSWKFNAIGAGFSGGLKALCGNFGIEVVEENPTPEILPPAPIENPERKKNSHKKKIELHKGQKINLVKKNSSLGEIVINLNWNESAIHHGTDLDLCCLFELTDGYLGAIQSLGNLFGNFSDEPYISLDGDDRIGNLHTAETIRINGKFADKIQGVLIYVSVYSGNVDWEKLGGFISIKCPNNPEIIIKIDEYGSKKKTCAVALFENFGGTFSIEKVVSFYHDSHSMDVAFDWGLDWTTGEK